MNSDSRLDKNKISRRYTTNQSEQSTHSNSAKMPNSDQKQLTLSSTQNHFHQIRKSKIKSLARMAILLIVTLAQIIIISVVQAQWSAPHSSSQRPLGTTGSGDPFPGVSRDLASFCAARPSLPIDVASMVVHVKRNSSFNYKLYLFSGNHVFQTGQVIPRDEFRIHSFPVKFKPLVEFWPPKVDTFQYNDSKFSSLTRIPSETFNLKQFLKPVPLNPSSSSSTHHKKAQQTKQQADHEQQDNKNQHPTRLPEDLHGDSLPGDPQPEFISHDVAKVMEHRERKRQMGGTDEVHSYNENYNKHIKFDRDDQLSITRNIDSVMEGASTSGAPPTSGHLSSSSSSPSPSSSALGDDIIPVGSFSSFHVNLTYFVRKDFGQLEPELVRVHIDAGQFVVNELVLINGIHSLGNASSTKPHSSDHQRHNHEDYSFLQHKLIRDTNTRITAINQIYEDWITRNFYTIVYIQRKLSTSSSSEQEEEGDGIDRDVEQQVVIVNDRLVFRGTSTSLLGAEQLDYPVKAAAFITEKNGLHYYLEFLTTGKFYLCAVDWTKRPFKMIDSRGFPIRATKTQLDNEELLLCPPSVCYSDRPVDEIVGYGRMLSLNNNNNDYLIANSKSSAINDNSNSNRGALIRSTNDNETLNLTLSSGGHPYRLTGLNLNSRRNATNLPAHVDSDDDGSLRLRVAEIETFKLSPIQLETKLHLRDWVWTLPRKLTTKQPLAASSSLIDLVSPTSSSAGGSSGSSMDGSGRANGSRTSFEWHYEMAKRNDIKVKQDTYGHVLTGHEIDASYRIYNELYLISANHLITINYTLINETVTSNQLLGDEFFGLSSTILDPITGAFYDRYENQIFFFKGDRYIGYNYTTRRPLDDFVLESPLSSMELDPIGINLFNGGPLVSTLPVVGILGRQHEVDGVYHDYFSDFVYIFSGMKFYKFLASNFKNGTFKPEVGQNLPPMECINEHFLAGCHFDRAFPNPCVSDTSTTSATDELDDGEVLHNTGDHEEPAPKHHQKPSPSGGGGGGRNRFDGGRLKVAAVGEGNFFEEQQMKLRSIAARKPGGLMNILKENSLLKMAGGGGEPFDTGSMPPPEESGQADDGTISQHGFEQEPQQHQNATNASASSSNRSQETLFVYLLITMIVLTCLVSILLILVLIYWSSSRTSSQRSQVPPSSQQQQQHHHHHQHHPFHDPNNCLGNQGEHQTRRALGTLGGAVAAVANTHQLAYGGRLMNPKQLIGSGVVKTPTSSGTSGQDTRSNSSRNSSDGSIDNSAL